MAAGGLSSLLHFAAPFLLSFIFWVLHSLTHKTSLCLPLMAGWWLFWSTACLASTCLGAHLTLAWMLFEPSAGVAHRQARGTSTGPLRLQPARGGAAVLSFLFTSPRAGHSLSSQEYSVALAGAQMTDLSPRRGLKDTKKQVQPVTSSKSHTF